jgi:rRNA maturation RNase YbeY
MNPPEIYFHYEISGFALEQEDQIATWLAHVAVREKKELAVLNYVFCSDDHLLGINQEYLQHDFYTDILSFPLRSDPIEGDIFISVDRVRENAHAYEVSFENELNRVMVHGLLHFLGYNDQTEDEKNLMREKENEYLQVLGTVSC